MIWKTRRHSLDLSRRGMIMGVLNVTPDSFSDGGEYLDPDKAVRRALEMIREGADIVDIGGESSRPGAEPVGAAEEMRRVAPVVERLRAQSDVLISVDTIKSEVAARALAAGADIINDISGLRADPDMAGTAAQARAGLVLMHMQGTPRTMQQAPTYHDVVAEIVQSLAQSMEAACRAGADPESCVLDPGIGFGKSLAHNLTILRRIEEFSRRGRPLLMGLSRKSFIGRVTSAADRKWPTVALTSYAREKGVRILRVHDVRENVQALRMTEAILGG